MSKHKKTVGVLLTGSGTPKIPGDPAHPMTFTFPIITEELKGVTITDLLSKNMQTRDTILRGARKLEEKGAAFVIGDCGLFCSFQKEVSSALKTTFISSSLVFVPFLEQVCSGKIGILAGDSRLETKEFFASVGINTKEIKVCGMEKAPEFSRVVLEGSKQMNINKMKRDIANLVKDFISSNKDVNCLLLECTNLIPFASYLQREASLPVFDIVLLTDVFYNALSRIDFLKGGDASSGDSNERISQDYIS